MDSGIQIAFAISDSTAMVAMFLTVVVGLGLTWFAHTKRTQSFGHSWHKLDDSDDQQPGNGY